MRGGLGPHILVVFIIPTSLSLSPKRGAAIGRVILENSRFIPETPIWSNLQFCRPLDSGRVPGVSCREKSGNTYPQNTPGTPHSSDQRIYLCQCPYALSLEVPPFFPKSVFKFLWVFGNWIGEETSGRIRA